MTAAAVTEAGSTDADALTEALRGLEVNTVVGPVAWGQEGLPPYIAKTPLTGGQWRSIDGGDHPFDLLVVSNTLAPTYRWAAPSSRSTDRGRDTRGATVQVAGLHKRFCMVVTASDVTFDVAAGAALGIVGPNGAGKSSLLNLVNGTVRARRMPPRPASQRSRLPVDGVEVIRMVDTPLGVAWVNCAEAEFIRVQADGVPFEVLVAELLSPGSGKLGGNLIRL